MKKLFKSKTDRIAAGILGGIGEYFNIDPSLLRVFWTLIVVLTGIFPGIIAYVVAVAVVPTRPNGK